MYPETPMRPCPERSSGNRLHNITTELDNILPKIFLDAKITPLKYMLVENAKSSVCVSVTDAGSKKYFVKICPDDSIVTEIFWRKKAHENNIPAPRTIFADTSRNKVPFMYEVLEFIDGLTLEYRCFDTYDKYTKLIGQELRKLHSIPADGFGRICAGSHWSCKTWREALEKHIDISKEDVARELFSAKELEKLHKYVFSDKRLDITQAKFLHGDVSTSNFIFSEKRNKIIFLDPGNTIGGDPMMDLAYASIPSANSSFFRGIKDGYEMKSPLTGEENYRLKRLRLICLASTAVGLYLKKDRKYARFSIPAKELLEKL